MSVFSTDKKILYLNVASILISNGFQLRMQQDGDVYKLYIINESKLEDEFEKALNDQELQGYLTSDRKKTILNEMVKGVTLCE